MNDKINNTLFERKHHYVTILKESELLKQQMSEELYDGTIEAVRLDEINQLCNLAFAGLLQEGLEFRYSRDTDASKESLIMTIDHVDYRCRVSALRGVLKDRLNGYLSGEKVSKRSEGFSVPSMETHTISSPDNPPEKPDFFSKALDIDTASDPVAKPEPILEPKNKDVATQDGKKNAIGRRGGWPFGGHKMEFPKEDDAMPDTNKRFDFSESESARAGHGTSLSAKEKSPVEPDVDDEENEEDSFEDELLSNLLKDLISKGDLFEEEEEEEEEEQDISPKHGVVEDMPARDASEKNAPSVRERNIEVENVFMEEREKHKDTLCYQTHRIAIFPPKDEPGAEVEEIFFMIAPCEIERTPDNIPCVPVVAYAYYRDEAFFVASYENGGPGKYLVKMNIGKYEFLIRGVFDNYAFESFIFTTGECAKKNYELKQLDTKIHNADPAKVRNGHIKFRFDGKDEGCVETIDAFPVNEGDNTFVVLHKIEHPTKGEFMNKFCTEVHEKILVQTREGLRKVICYWDGDTIKAELVKP